jgi:hypothetical protein
MESDVSREIFGATKIVTLLDMAVRKPALFQVLLVVIFRNITGLRGYDLSHNRPLKLRLPSLFRRLCGGFLLGIVDENG